MITVSLNSREARVQIRNIILDWSGTLVNDLRPVWQTTNRVLETYGATPLTLEQFREEFRLPIREFYREHLPHVPLEELSEVFLRYYAGVRHQIAPLPHAGAFLQFCAERAMPVFVASSVDHETYRLQMKRFGFDGYITRPYLAMTDKTQQIPRILLENRLIARQTIFVGDMEHDIAAGRAAGVRTCAVLTGYSPARKLRAMQPDCVCEHLGELQEKLRG
ncbi:MAG: HAD family hydrolase [Verrucomicrobiae bacterium]|nr:HAD family hydrolase [Verrucomicrobiae bacterium]